MQVVEKKQTDLEDVLLDFFMKWLIDLTITFI